MTNEPGTEKIEHRQAMECSSSECQCSCHLCAMCQEPLMRKHTPAPGAAALQYCESCNYRVSRTIRMYRVDQNDTYMGGLNDECTKAP